MQSPDKLVTIDHDGNHPPPRRIEESLDSITRKRSRTPVRSPSPTLPVVNEYSPASPTPSQLDLPENERPASWPPADETAPEKVKSASLSSVSVTTQAASPVTTVKSPPPTSSAFPPEGFLPVLPHPPTLTPSPAAQALQERIEESVAREAERRLAHYGQPPILRPASPMSYGPSTLLLRPAHTFPASSSWGPINAYEVLEPATCPPPHLFHGGPNDENDVDDDLDDDAGAHMLPTINDCLQQAFDFNQDFHTRGEPPYPHAALSRTNDPVARRRTIKRYNARTKRAQAPEDEQRALQWRALQRRAAKAAHAGRVSFVLLTLYIIFSLITFLNENPLLAGYYRTFQGPYRMTLLPLFTAVALSQRDTYRMPLWSSNEFIRNYVKSRDPNRAMALTHVAVARELRIRCAHARVSHMAARFPRCLTVLVLSLLLYGAEGALAPNTCGAALPLAWALGLPVSLIARPGFVARPTLVSHRLRTGRATLVGPTAAFSPWPPTMFEGRGLAVVVGPTWALSFGRAPSLSLWKPLRL